MTEDLVVISAQVDSANKEHIVLKAIKKSWLVVVITAIFPADGMEKLLNIIVLTRRTGKD